MSIIPKSMQILKSRINCEFKDNNYYQNVDKRIRNIQKAANNFDIDLYREFPLNYLHFTNVNIFTTPTLGRLTIMLAKALQLALPSHQLIY